MCHRRTGAQACGWAQAGCPRERGERQCVGWHAARPVLPLIAGTLTSARDVLCPACARLTSAVQGHPLTGLKGKLGDMRVSGLYRLLWKGRR